jgi:hypothetical protein
VELGVLIGGKIGKEKRKRAAGRKKKERKNIGECTFCLFICAIPLVKH